MATDTNNTGVRTDSDGSGVVKGPVEARQSHKTGHMRYVLTIGIVLAVLAMILVYMGVV